MTPEEREALYHAQEEALSQDFDPCREPGDSIEVELRSGYFLPEPFWKPPKGEGELEESQGCLSWDQKWRRLKDEIESIEERHGGLK